MEYVEQGRWLGTARNQRFCHLCATPSQQSVGDEFRFIFKCSLFETQRKEILILRQCRNPNMLLFRKLMSTLNKQKLVKLCKFIFCILKTIKQTTQHCNLL